MVMTVLTYSNKFHLFGIHSQTSQLDVSISFADMQQSPLSKLCAATLHSSSQISSPIQSSGQSDSSPAGYSGPAPAPAPGSPGAPTSPPPFACNSSINGLDF